MERHGPHAATIAPIWTVLLKLDWISCLSEVQRKGPGQLIMLGCDANWKRIQYKTMRSLKEIVVRMPSIDI